ncbi:hypothetical protein [Sphingomonas sp. PP-CE-1G-424]|uniref:hypothetical protein n=1 Tax=Sphingomonas sp. PP-CE-1G-424 TaxID=2135658 RepID=UPI001055FD4B|nr:hypothetical protein [Sphingomonas sp. PP-CE-1G-424]
MVEAPDDGFADDRPLFRAFAEPKVGDRSVSQHFHFVMRSLVRGRKDLVPERHAVFAGKRGARVKDDGVGKKSANDNGLVILTLKDLGPIHCAIAHLADNPERRSGLP